MVDEKEREDDEGEGDEAAVSIERAAKKKKLLLLGGVAVLLLGLMAGGTWFAIHLLADKPESAASTEPVAAEGQADKDAKDKDGKDSKSKDSKDKKADAKAEKKLKEPALYEVLDPAFLANYTVGGRQHYFQLSLAVMARDEATMAALHAHMPTVRNRVVLLLSGEVFEHLQTDEGRVELQQKLLTAIQEILKKETGKPGIEQVFFTNFVLQ